MHLKRLETIWKALLMRLLLVIFGRGARVSPSDWRCRAHRVLFLRHDRIGDMIVSTSLIRAIAASDPQVVLDVLASPINAPILAAEPSVARVILFDRSRPWRWARSLREMRRARYDAVVDPMVFAPSLTTLLLMLGSGARHRIGVGGRSNAGVYTITVPRNAAATHHIEHTAALAAAFGVEMAKTDWRPLVPLTAAESEEGERAWRAYESSIRSPVGRRLLVNVSTGGAFRQWPDERFVEVIVHCRQRDPHLTILVMGAPDEAARVERIARAGGVTAVGTATIRSALALVATADLLFSPDTSIGHAASVYRKPAVIMFVRGKAALWGLYRTPGRNIVSPDETLVSIPCAPVLGALDELLQTPALVK